jgi:hypothetical protein
MYRDMSAALADTLPAAAVSTASNGFGGCDARRYPFESRG